MKNYPSIRVTGRKSLEYHLLDHTADMGMEVSGSDPADLFSNAGMALIHIMLGEIPEKGLSSVKISLTGEDLPDLMVRWLTEILFLFEGERLITTDVVVINQSSTALDASLLVTPFDPSLHEILREIKAVTYHQIEVTLQNDVWIARVIFDL
jgi:SHS2 domain-containing protein